jgi:predicted NBD/HSP70 family sugar kinase
MLTEKIIIKKSIDPKFIPISLKNKIWNELLSTTQDKQNIYIGILDDTNNFHVKKRVIFSSHHPLADNNFLYVEKIIKSMIWIFGGIKIYLDVPLEIFNEMKHIFSKNGKYHFDVSFMEKVYHQDFEIVLKNVNAFPKSKTSEKKIQDNPKGNFIGFDAGGSDRKVSAIKDGEVIFSNETIWHPKIQSNPQYHYDGIMDSIKKAATYLEKIDGIGVSSAGVIQHNEIKVASLFMSVPEHRFENEVKNMYINIGKSLNTPLEVANDGDVTAIAGAISFNKFPILGIAMGTSEAAGYVNSNKAINGWLNELAFVPVDYNPNQDIDPWSKDIGTGVNYLSQDGVIRLAKLVDLDVDDTLTPAEKLTYIQHEFKNNNPKAIQIFENIGIYLGFAVAYYKEFYDFNDVLILGRVTSGLSGCTILNSAKEVLSAYFNFHEINILLPNEKFRRVGQSIASASLIKSNG